MSASILDVSPETQKKAENVSDRMEKGIKDAGDYLSNTTPTQMAKDLENKGKKALNYAKNTTPNEMVQDLKTKGERLTTDLNKETNIDKAKNFLSDTGENIKRGANRAFRDPWFYGSLGASAAAGLGAYALRKHMDKKKKASESPRR